MEYPPPDDAETVRLITAHNCGIRAFDARIKINASVERLPANPYSEVEGWAYELGWRLAEDLMNCHLQSPSR